MAGDIFISYRRDDEPGMATAPYCQLEQAFSAVRLFMDVEGGIAPGRDFVRAQPVKGQPPGLITAQRYREATVVKSKDALWMADGSETREMLVTRSASAASQSSTAAVLSVMHSFC